MSLQVVNLHHAVLYITNLCEHHRH